MFLLLLLVGILKRWFLSLSIMAERVICTTTVLLKLQILTVKKYILLVFTVQTVYMYDCRYDDT